MKNKINNIKRDQNKRKKFLKSELKKLILKSIIQNLNLKPNIRAWAWRKIIKHKKRSFLSFQKNNLCLKSGRFKGTLKKIQVTRHETKKLSLIGSLQNIKVSSW